MKFTIENVGPIKKSEMEFGDLTILCGKNNTGKTYITYNTFNYIDAIKYFLNVPVEKKYAEELLASGKILLDLAPFFQRANKYVELSMKNWMPYVASQMATHEDYYRNINMKLDLGKEHLTSILLDSHFSGPVQVTKDCFLKVSKKEKILTVILQNNSPQLPDIDVVVGQLEWMLKTIIQHLIPDLFIITCERTGAAAFMPTFIASREIAAKQDRDTKLMEDVYRKMDFRGYPRPMNKDLEFVVRFPEAIQKRSFIAEKHPEILEYFSEIVGGEYRLDEPNIVKFVPQNSNVGLTTVESSSSVRSLMELNFYLKHKAKKYQALIIDEPELNLHPENQRKMARLIAMLVNAGIYVAISTHSDYIIRELNTLITLKQNLTHLAKIKKAEGYSDCELLDASRIKAYVAQKGKDGVSFESAPVSQEDGIVISSLDDVIDKMNQIQDKITWGEE